MPVSAWADPIDPAADGAWRCTWITPASRAEAMRRIRAALTRNGWRIESASADGISAEKAGEQLDISVDEAAGGSGGPAEVGGESTQVYAVLRVVDGPGTP